MLVISKTILICVTSFMDDRNAYMSDVNSGGDVKQYLNMRDVICRRPFVITNAEDGEFIIM